MLGEFIKQAREQRGLSQEELGEPYFSRAYISALERGAVQPSQLALGFIAERFGVSGDTLVDDASRFERQNESESEAVSLPPDTTASEEDLHYQLNYATTLIHSSQVDKALNLIDQVDSWVAPCRERLSGRARYRVPYLRGMAYLQVGKPGLAQPELENALLIATGAAENLASENRAPANILPLVRAVQTAQSVRTKRLTRRKVKVTGAGKKRSELEELFEIDARIRNLLGVSLSMQKKLVQAEEQQIHCLHAVEDGKVKDIGLKFSIYANLVNTYWAASKYDQAITIGNEALRLFKDLADPLRLAGLEWNLSMAYKANGENDFAKLHTQRALDIYVAKNVFLAAATTAINLAELLIEDKQYPEAEKKLHEGAVLIQKAGAGDAVPVAAVALSKETAIPLTLSNLYQNHARLAREQGQVDEASMYAAQSINLTEAVYKKVAADTTQASTYPSHYYAQALHAGALVEEALGNRDTADRLFEQALSVVGHTGFERARESIMKSYASVLKGRGDFARALTYIEMAATVRLAASSIY
jgi:tetratricopeptide (TPR) repeat protein